MTTWLDWLKSECPQAQVTDTTKKDTQGKEKHGKVSK